MTNFLSFKFMLAVLLLSGFSALAQQLNVHSLHLEHQVNPLTVTSETPRFSWQITSKAKAVFQRSYTLRMGMDSNTLKRGEGVMWQVNKASDQSVLVEYSGPKLNSVQRYYWQVKVKDNKGEESGWSRVQYWQMALKPSEWKAKWISFTGSDTSKKSPIFRKTYTLKREIKSATAFITAKGLYEASINGARIGNGYFTPGWTSYNTRLQYQAYDITSMLKQGANTFAASLADGWYKGELTWLGKFNIYGNTRALLMQIDVLYADGSKEVLGSDGSWKTSTGPIISSSLYDGEVYDARREKVNWEMPDYQEDTSWIPVSIQSFSYENIVGMNGPLVRQHERINPINIFKTKSGATVADFGQNLVGWVEVRIKGVKGKKITLTHAEVLNKDGDLYTTNLRGANQRDVFIPKGNGKESYAPHFTFHGFRYVKIEGYESNIENSDLTAVVLHSDMPQTGYFKTSDSLLNQLQHNIIWGQKGNFLDVPTDCPQRDERLGWTGDAQAFYNTAAYNMDVSGFFSKWLKDLSADQHVNGSVPFVIPDVLGKQDAGSAGWGDVATIVPWQMFQTYGDKKIVEEQYPSMKKWVDYITDRSVGNLWNSGFHFGDWLFYRPDDDNDGRAAVTDKYLIAQCFYAYSTQLLADACGVMGKKDEQSKYLDLLSRVKAAFLKEYVTPNGRLVSSTQTAYVLALNFDMLPESLRMEAAENLVKNIKDYGNHITTGFLGTPYICQVLTRFGYNSVAYDLLMQQTYPSWLYPVKMGATTIWERWDGIKPDGSFQTPGMNSYNHYAYGAIGEWMYKNIAGIQSSLPGYKKFTIKPIPGGKLLWAEASFESVYGKISSSWKIESGKFKLKVSIPANTSAEVFVPDASGSNFIKYDRSSGDYYFEH